MSLLEELKNYLDVTWTDEATDNKINGILNRASNILSSYAGEKLTFDETQESEKQWLFDCCSYIYCNAFEDFKVNFAADLVNLRGKYAVKEIELDEEVSEV